MQQLSGELKNTPRSTSLAPCSVNTYLNMDKYPSAVGVRLTDNNPEENLHQHTGDQTTRVSDIVYVLNMRGNPLMPTKQQKARRLIREGKAKVVKRNPYTIQLTIATGETKQKITLGIDPGYANLGFSCVSPKRELLCGVVELENGMVKRLKEKSIYRRLRRNRHHWYRPARYENRKSKKSGWIPPSVKRRYETTLHLVRKLKQILPISDIYVEVAKFDIQKIKNPDISGIQYQRGAMYEYRNRLEYLKAREKLKCQYCNTKFASPSNPWRLHHIWGKEKDRPNDWALVHEKCHKDLHKNQKEKSLRKNRSKSYKGATYMNIVRGRYKPDLNCNITYGNITSQNRIELGLEKTHYNDAFVIAGGTIQEHCSPFLIIQKRRNNRSLQTNYNHPRKKLKFKVKGLDRSRAIRKQRHKFQPLDLVKYKGVVYINKGTDSGGTRVNLYRNIEDRKRVKYVAKANRIEKNVIPIMVNPEKLDKWHFSQPTLVWFRSCG